MAKKRVKKPIKYYSAKRRAIYARGDSIDALTLFNMYGWMCVICSEPIDRYRRVPDWRAATIEHVIPLALGGQHTFENCRPAHLKCNQDKGDSLPDDLMQNAGCDTMDT